MWLLRILHLIHQFPPERCGGAEGHAEQLARVQAETHDVLIYTQSVEHQGPGAREEEDKGFRVRRWTDRGPRARVALAEDLSAAARDFSPHVFHLHHGIGFPPEALLTLAEVYPSVLTLHDYWWMCPRIRLLYCGETPCPGPVPLSRCTKCHRGEASRLLVGEAAALFARGPWLGLARSARSRAGQDPEALRGKTSKAALAQALRRITPLRRSFFRRRRRACRNLIAACGAIISPSRYLPTRYRKGDLPLPQDRLHFLPYGIDREDIPRGEGKEVGRPPRFALVGHLNREKGVDLAMGAFRDIPEGQARLDLYGPVELSRSAEKVLAAKGNQIRCHGPFDAQGRRDIWRRIDVLILPSLWVENAPKVLHEAFAARVPVLAADHGALPEFVGENRGGWLFVAHDAFHLRAVIEELTESPEKIIEAQQSIPSPRRIAEVAERIEEIYNEVMASGGSKRPRTQEVPGATVQQEAGEFL